MTSQKIFSSINTSNEYLQTMPQKPLHIIPQLTPEGLELVKRLQKALDKINDSELQFATQPNLNDLIIKNPEEYMLISLHRCKAVSEKAAQTQKLFKNYVGHKNSLFK